ncbi:MAG: glutamine synthetase [Gaiellales bacterium]|nr:glutamine synthetase [Gaiellales bacterium]
MLTLEELGAEVASGRVDTVIIAMCDMQGRLQGKRLSARAFVEGIAEHGAEGCNYLLSVDVEMNPAQGYAMSSWERGYGDFVFMPDLATLRRIPWLESTVMVQCDLLWHDGSPVAASPRQVLRRQLERVAERGWTAFAGSELEFILFDETYETARGKGWRGLRAANAYNVDYSILGTTMVEPVVGAIRRSMAGAGMLVEDSKGECNLGQHEVNFRYQEALRMADDHVVYRNGAKEIAFLQGKALTFMPKFDEREGNSCHIHLSLWEEGKGLFPDGDGHEMSETFRRFIAGLVRHTRELTLLLAPNVNSYKRFVRGSFAPTALVWGHDNRTCALRVVGGGPGMRVEHRVAGGDVNPYLAFAALLAAGLAGIDGAYELAPPWTGSGYDAPGEPHVPSTLHEARELFAGSELARSALGDEVVEHYLNAATVELDAYDAAVTDWELKRSFERL